MCVCRVGGWQVCVCVQSGRVTCSVCVCSVTCSVCVCSGRVTSVCVCAEWEGGQCVCTEWEGGRCVCVQSGRVASAYVSSMSECSSHSLCVMVE